ncbi:hypothetical protein PR048_020766 [Dryococelus australis]|uniref:Uncharacterized protein n=1 Tax=Dryococelus australis TaxID=614101 RepID=A0ABQ9GWF0_9NEOP|nr:hypothetical protein PR048_020766 [Dryococelus australis]
MTSTTDNVSRETHSKRISSLKPPAAFDFLAPLLWKQRKQRFCRYMSVSGCTDKTDEKIDILLYVLGEKVKELWTHFTQHPASYKEALQDFENHFNPCRNDSIWSTRSLITMSNSSVKKTAAIGKTSCLGFSKSSCFPKPTSQGATHTSVQCKFWGKGQHDHSQCLARSSSCSKQGH